MLIAILNSNTPVKRIIASDINECLVECYKCIQRNPQRLLEECAKLRDAYSSCPDTRSEFYYQRRAEFNQHKNRVQDNPFFVSALFLFLNKQGFRGIYRENASGEFNVPYGNYTTMDFFDAENILLLHAQFQSVQFIHASFDQLFQQEIHPMDFVYFDPPYQKEKETDFVNYVKSGFSNAQQQRLFELCRKIPRWILSNSNTEENVRRYSEIGQVKVLSVSRGVFCKPNESKKFTEIIVYSDQLANSKIN